MNQSAAFADFPLLEPTLEEQKAVARSCAATSFRNALAAARATVDASGGQITINADSTAAANIQGLLLTLGDAPTVSFRDAANEFQEVSRADLENMLVAIAATSQALYRKKWQLVERIDQAATAEELNAIDIGLLEMASKACRFCQGNRANNHIYLILLEVQTFILKFLFSNYK